MKLPISLLLLAALGEAVDLTTEVSKTSTIKRELREGVFGQRTEQLKKYVPTQSTPEYTTNDLKVTSADQTPTQQTFGAKLPQITKISDLLTAQGPSFELALANHLYSPVSAYNFKLPSFEEKLNTATKNFFSKTKNFKHYKHNEETKHNSQDLQSKQNTAQTTDLFSYINSDFRPGPVSPPFPFGPALSGIDTSVAASHNPQKFSLFGAQTPFGFHLRGPNHNELLHRYDARSQVFPPNFGFENENLVQKEKEESKEEKESQKYELPEQNTLEKQQPIPIEVYNSHPNGAVSYASFLSNQFFDGHPESQELFKQFSKSPKQPLEAILRQQQQFYVPQHYRPEQKDASPESQKEFYSGPHKQQLLLYPSAHSDKSSIGQFISIPLSHYKELYLNANRQQLDHDFQQGAARQSQGLRQPPLNFKNVQSTAESEPLGQSSTQSPSTYQTVSNHETENAPTRFTDQPDKSETIDDSSVRIYLPTPGSTTHPLSVQPLYPHSTVESHVAITPKSQLTQYDQATRSTTVHPETVRNIPGNSQKSSISYHDSNTFKGPQPTLQSVLSSPATLQSSSIRKPEHYSSTTLQPEIFISSQSHLQTTPHQPIQLQRLELDPASAEPTQHTKGLDNAHPTVSSSPQYHDLSTPRPSEPSTIDYEIEIASNVDHSQLPKDLRPVPSAQRHIESEFQQTQQRKEQAYRQGLHLQEGKIRPHTQGIHPHSQLNHLHQGISSFDRNVSPFLRPLLSPIQPLIQPRAFSGVQEVVVPASDFQQSYLPTFPSVQYFGNFAGPLFGNIEG